MKILNQILKTKTFVDIVQPVPQEYLAGLAYKFSNPHTSIAAKEHEYYKLKLHVEGISLLTESFKNYKQGI